MKIVKKQYAKFPEKLSKFQASFAEAYVRSYNGVQSVLELRPDFGYQHAASRANQLLRNPAVKKYIEELNGDLARVSQVPKLRLLLEQKAIAFSNISDVYENWHELKDFDKLTKEQKAAIAEIDCKVVNTIGRRGEAIETRYIRVRMHDKLKAIENLAKMLGYNEPERIQAEVASINLVLGSDDLIKKMEDE